MTVPSVTTVRQALTGSGSTLGGTIQPTGSNRLLLCFTASFDAGAPVPTGVTFNTTETFTRWSTGAPADGSIWQGGSGSVTVWYLKNPTNTNATATATWSQAQDAAACVFVALQDVDQTTPLGTIASEVDTTDNNANCSPSTSTNDLVMAALAYFDVATYTPGGSQTARATSDGGGAESITVSSVTGSASSTALSYSYSANSDCTLLGFAVHGTTAGPGLVSLSPADNTQNVGAIRTLTIVFDENVQAVSGNITINETGGSTIETISISDTSKVTFSSATVTITCAALPRGKNINVQVANGAIEATGDNEDWSGITDTATWNFDTFPATWQSAGTEAYSTSGGSSVAPSYPASLASGNGIVLIVGQKPSSANGGTCTTPTGFYRWAEITGATDGDTGGYTTTLGADTGNTNLFVFFKQSDGTETGTLSVTVGTNNICWGVMYRVTKASDCGWLLGSTTGKDTTGSGNVSVTFAADPGTALNDVIIAAFCQPTDVTTPAQFSAEALTQTGVTFGTITEDLEADSSVGNDIGGYVVHCRPTAGPSSAAPSMTATAGGTNTNVRGPAVFLRLRADQALPTTFVETVTYPTPTVTPGSATANPTTHVSTTVFPVAAASASITATPTTVVETPTFPVPDVSNGGSPDVAPTNYTSTAVFPAPTATPGSVQGSPDLVTSTAVISVPALSASITASPPLDSSTATFPAPTATPGSATGSAPALALSATIPIPSVAFANPLHLNAHASGRYFVNDIGTPFWFSGDAAWSLIAQLSGTDLTDYLDAMRTARVHAVLVNLFEHLNSSDPPNNAVGVAPFTTPEDVRTLNLSYFTHALTVIRAAADRGIIVFLAHFYSGFGGDNEGWYNASIAPRSTGDLTTFGAAIGTALGAEPNIVWVQSGDYTPASQTKINAIMDGIRSTEAIRHMVTYSPTNNTSPRDISGLTTLDCSFEYWYVEDYADGLSSDLRDAYNKSPAKPWFLGETFYDNRSSAPATIRWLRAQLYAAILYGGGGSGFPGDENRWHFQDGWQTSLTGTGELTPCYPAWSIAFESRRWYDLVPDLSNALVTAGRGTLGLVAYVPAALTADGKFGALYTYSGASVTVSLAQFSGTVTAQWCDPCTGQLYAATGSPFAASGTHAFVASSERGNNANGDADWLLLLETEPLQTASPSAHTSTPTFAAPSGSIPQTASAPQKVETATYPAPTGTLGAATGSPPANPFAPTIPAPTGTAGAVTGNPALLSSTAVLSVPSVTPGEVTGFPPQLVSTPVLPTAAGLPSVAASPITILSTPTFGAPIGSLNDQQIGAPPALVSTSVLPAPAGTPGSVTGSPSLVVSTPAFGPPSANADITAAAPLLQSIVDLFAPSGAAGAVTASAPLLTSAPVLLLPTVINNTTYAYPTLDSVIVVFGSPMVAIESVFHGAISGGTGELVVPVAGGALALGVPVRGGALREDE